MPFAPDFVGPRHRLREGLLLQLLLAADPEKRILNAGAGQGTLSAHLERRDFTVTSVDNNAEVIAYLRGRVRGEVVQADVRALPFDDCQFDAVVLGEVLEHVSEDAAALREVARVVRPGGVVAISVPANPLYFGPCDEWAGHVRRYTRSGLLGVVESAQLEVERCVAWGFPLSTIYHRYLYESRLKRVGARPLGTLQRLMLTTLGMALNADRLFVGVERGALGYLLIARCASLVTIENTGQGSDRI
jgi:2-polyprenyl-3-methyl-5-hydroxy-6-metoxy-1,4-benzoquinol methylase